MKTEDLKPLPGFPNHFMTPDSFVFSLRSGRKLARRWTAKKGWYTRIPDEQGVVRAVYHASPPVAPTPDPETVIRNLKLVRVPGYPKYLCSPEGAVYRVSVGKVVPVSEHLRGFQSYVNVVSETGQRHSRNVDHLVSLAHGKGPENA